MKTQFFKIFALVALITFSSCGDKAKEAKTSDAEDAAVPEITAVTYKVNTENSMIEWKGFKPTGTHNGTISLRGGKLDLNKVNLIGYSDGAIIGMLVTHMMPEQIDKLVFGAGALNPKASKPEGLNMLINISPEILPEEFVNA